MKKIMFFIGMYFLISCSPSKEEQLISDYEQTIGNTKTNLNLKFNKVEFVKDITSKDSLDNLIKYFNEEQGNMIKKIERDLKLSEENLVVNKKILNILKDYEFSRKMYQKKIDSLELIIKVSHEYIEKYNGDCKGTFLEETLNKINKLETNLDSVLSKEYDVVYTINNPLLNNVEQTISKTYFIDSDLTKIIKVTND